MKNKSYKVTTRTRLYIWRIVAMVIACSILYYLPVIVGLAGWAPQQDVLNRFHNFYGIDFYALVFFIPSIYAAYVRGVVGALATAFVCMLILLPYTILIDSFPNALFKPVAFVIILAAVSAVVAMLQKGDEQRRRSVEELKCLYNIGKAATESDSVDEFTSTVVELISQTMQYLEETRVRITIREKVFESPDFAELPNRVREDLVAGGETLGSVEIFSTRGNYHLKNEQDHLIKTITERIGGAIREIELEQSLQGYYEQLEKMVDKRTKDLEEAQEWLRLLSNTVKSSIDGITLIDMEGKLTFANEASLKMWGYSSHELTQLKMSHLYSSDELDLVENEIIPCSRASVWSGELTARRKDGSEFPVFVTTSPVHDEGRQTIAIVGVHRDISETREMKEKLIRTERLAAVGELASGVGHELRNPLNVIRNCMYLLRMTLADETDNETLNTLKILDKQVDISNRIVTDLLDFTRVRPPLVANVNLNELIKESLSWVVVPGKISVVSDLDVNSPKVFVDAEQIGRAFGNIISNAVQAMNGGGELKISSGLGNGAAWVKFQDTGCGIPEEMLDKIFDPLVTTKPKGIGLGLAITKRFVEQNKGAIEVTSQVSKGATFIVKLPIIKKRGS